MMWLKLVVGILLINAVLSSSPLAGFKMVRCLLDERQVTTVDQWGLDVWSRDSTLAPGWNDIVVNAAHISELEKMSVEYEVIVDDLLASLEKEQRLVDEARQNANAADFFDAYHTYDEIIAYLQQLTSANPTVAKFIPAIGTTIQGRNIPGVVITGTATGNKKQVIVTAGQHAREWVSPATTLYILTNLITLYPSNSTVKALLDSTIFHFLPLINGDGYTYTWLGASQRLWRKNRRLNQGGSYGVDLNRNWNDHWGNFSSHTPTSDTYCGTAPFSEPESKAIETYTSANGPFAGALDVHSYSQVYLRPYGYQRTPPANDAKSKAIADGMIARIRATTGAVYTTETIWTFTGTGAGGSSVDYWVNVAKIPIAYGPELRDRGTYGFQLPANQIKPCGEENLAAFFYFVQNL